MNDEIQDEASKHGMCCSICLVTGNIVFTLTRLQYFASITYLRRTSDQPAFIFDVETSTIVQQGENAIKKKENLVSSQIYVGDILEAIEILYKQFKCQVVYDIAEELSFVAIANYFRKNLMELCEGVNICLDQLFITFTIPNYFAFDQEAVEVIIKPLFVKMGVIPTKEESARITLLTHLELLFACYQVHGSHTRKPYTLFLRRENQCLVYNINLDDELTQWEVAHVQLKEDYSASLFHRRFYSPKFMSVQHNPNLVNMDFTSINLKFTDFVVTETLNLDKSSISDNSVFDRIVLCVLFNVVTSKTHHFSCYYGITHTQRKSDERFLRKYLTDEQIALIQSNSFSESVLQLFSNMFSCLVDQTVNFVRSPHTVHSHVSKSLVVNGNLKSRHTFNYCIYLIFFHFLQKSLDSVYNVYTNLTSFRRALNNPCSTFGSAFDCGYLLVGRRMMVSNVNLPPLIINKQTARSNSKVTLPLKPHSQLGYIVYFEISFDSTVVVCSRIDNDGRIIDSFNICLQDKFQSLGAFLNSKMIDPDNLTNEKQLNKYKGYSDLPQSLLSTIPPKVLNLINRYSPRKRSINMHAVEDNTKEYFLAYLKKLVDLVVVELENLQVDIDQVGYVFCLENPIMKNLFVGSQEELLEFVTKNDLVPSNNSLSKNIALVDQGDELVWQMLQSTKIEHYSYYIHAHIADDYIYLKLYRVMETYTSNRGPSTLFIGEETIQMNNVYREVAELIFSYTQSLAEEEQCIYDFRLFEEKLVHFIKEELFSGSCQHRETSITFDCLEHNCTITIQELMDIAIIPLMKNVVNKIVATVSYNEFDVDKLFLTGHFLRIKNYSYIYQYLVETEIRKELEHILLRKSYKTTFDVSVITCQEQPSQHPIFDQQHLCYDRLIRGELQVISNSTYLLRKGFLRPLSKSLLSVEMKDATRKYGYSSEILFRGEQISKKRLRLDVIYDDQVRDWGRSFLLEFYDQDGTHKTSNIKAPGEMFISTNTNIPVTLEVEYVHHYSGLLLKADYYSYDKENNALKPETSQLMIIDRQVLKYF